MNEISKQALKCAKQEFNQKYDSPMSGPWETWMWFYLLEYAVGEWLETDGPFWSSPS